ncbi:FlgB family protein [Roseovarius rhodophyticola]|uniref:FlgB family protein n=1 Tax=Roseovarius rhodophyticola TaxID=3080827 RepID=A0ABZ2TJD6_9RHOB|nr:FlgB family protein [Roseovarius sp. W115]MDV2929985.1 FlgB family protein [Roseovarius sp. W115]
MFKNVEIFRIAQASAMHAGARQSVIAQNMANADTPGYAANDIPAFQTHVRSGEGEFALKATRGSHIHGNTTPMSFDVVKRSGALTDPNGNSVSVETEMLHAVDVKRQHDRAIAVYKSAMTMLRTSLGR